VDSHRPAKDEAILTSVAESIGATLGTIAAKAGSVQKAFADKVIATKPRVRRAVKAVVKKRTNLRGRRGRKTRAAGRAARRSRKKS
jgi:hypothetical protein